jgi:hypothetical protein
MRASAAILGHVNVHFTCHDAHSTQKQLILPWFTGSWSWDIPAHNNISVVARTKLIKHACCLFWCAALHQVRPDMLYDVRCMAMALVGDGQAKRTMTAPSTATSFVPQLATSLLPQSPLFHGRYCHGPTKNLQQNSWETYSLDGEQERWRRRLHCHHGQLLRPPTRSFASMT